MTTSEPPKKAAKKKIPIMSKIVYGIIFSVLPLSIFCFFSQNNELLWACGFFYITIDFVLIIFWLSMLDEKRETFKWDKSQIKKAQNKFRIGVMIYVQNEEIEVIKAFQSCLKQTYQASHIVIINDGSTDETLTEILFTGPFQKERKEGYNLFSHNNCYVIDKPKSNKAKSINMGLNFLENQECDFFVLLDCHSFLELNTLQEINRYLRVYPNTALLTGVRIPVLHKNKKGLIAEISCSLHKMESFNNHLFNLCFGEKNKSFISQNTLNIYNKYALMSLGGFTDTIDFEEEDMVLKMQKYDTEHKTEWGFRAAPNLVSYQTTPNHHNHFNHQKWLKCFFHHFSTLLSKKHAIGQDVMLVKAIYTVIPLLSLLSVFVGVYLAYQMKMPRFVGFLIGVKIVFDLLFSWHFLHCFKKMNSSIEKIHYKKIWIALFLNALTFNLISSIHKTWACLTYFKKPRTAVVKKEL